MAYIYYNPNPKGKLVGDCVIRGLTKILNKSWNDVFLDIVTESFIEKDMPSSNNVWGRYLLKNGFRCDVIEDMDCTIRDFCNQNTYGTFLLATGTHVVAVKNGNYYDAWDSGNEIPVYCWRKEE